MINLKNFLLLSLCTSAQICFTSEEPSKFSITSDQISFKKTDTELETINQQIKHLKQISNQENALKIEELKEKKDEIMAEQNNLLKRIKEELEQEKNSLKEELKSQYNIDFKRP